MSDYEDAPAARHWSKLYADILGLETIELANGDIPDAVALPIEQIVARAGTGGHNGHDLSDAGSVWSDDEVSRFLVERNVLNSRNRMFETRRTSGQCCAHSDRFWCLLSDIKETLFSGAYKRVFHIRVGKDTEDG